ncbi:MAG: hypothetical protein JNK72_22330 [Myxococcales bacterium]|nr:hypothetical protein [Myxococcales bacterium]
MRRFAALRWAPAEGVSLTLWPPGPRPSRSAPWEPLDGAWWGLAGPPQSPLGWRDAAPFEGPVWRPGQSLVGACEGATLSVSGLGVAALGEGLSWLHAHGEGGPAWLHLADEGATRSAGLFVEAGAVDAARWAAMVDALVAAGDVAGAAAARCLLPSAWRAGAGLVGWRSLLRVLEDPEMNQHFEAIAAAPQRAIRQRVATGALRADRVDDPGAVAQLRSQGRGRVEARGARPALDLDTDENRGVRAMLEEFAAQLSGYAGDPSLDPSRVEAARRSLSRWRARLDGAGLPRGPWSGRESARWHAHPAYAAVLEGWRASREAGLVRADAVADAMIAVSDPATLYERWCALEVAAALGLSAPQRSQLLRGQPVRCGEGVSLWFQRNFSGAETRSLGWRPDLAVAARGRWLLIDAKCRLAPSGEGPRDEIAKMHAYRDGIVGAVAAFALHPSEGDAALWFGGRNPVDGVGLLPLCPGVLERTVRSQRDALRGLLGGFVAPS